MKWEKDEEKTQSKFLSHCAINSKIQASHDKFQVAWFLAFVKLKVVCYVTLAVLGLRMRNIVKPEIEMM